MSTLLGKILADFTTSLATEIAVGGTTATLSSATDDDGVAVPSGRYFFTLDGSNSSKEHISCDLVGTALTNIKSLSRQGVETTGAVRKHRIGTSVSLTDFGHIKFINDLISGATSLNSSTPLGYDGAPSSLTGNQLATVTYVLGVVNGGTVTFDKQVISNQTSGEALTANDIVYFKGSDSKWYKADADLTATFDTLQLGIAQSTVGINTTVQIAISGPVSGFTGLTSGSKYYLSNTAGAITTSAGTNSVFVGWALSTTILLFDPVPQTLPTQKEKDALVGSQGIPSSTNKYATQDGQSTGLLDQSQTTQNGTVEIGEADSTLKKNKLAQSFIPAFTKIRGVNLWKIADTGAFTGTVTVSIQADSSGAPSGSALATVTLTNPQWSAFAVGANEIIFGTEYASLVVGSTYWIVVQTSTSDNSNHPNIGTNTAGGYSSGSVKYNNTTDGWAAIATIDLYFSTLQGTVSQVVKTNTSGKIESTFYDVTEMPIANTIQTIAPVDNVLITGTEWASGSNQSGSVFYLYTQNAGNLYRFERDTYTGIYLQTHSITPTFSPGAGDNGAIIVIGIYVYYFSNDGTNIKVVRFLAADLTGETIMTVPVVACTTFVIAWTDGTNAYVVSNTTNTTARKWSLSGTTFTAVSTATCTAASSPANSATMFDGTTAYIIENNGGVGTDFLIRKLTNINGSSQTTTTKTLGLIAETWVGAFLINIDTNRCFIGYMYAQYDEVAAVASPIRLVPISKP